MRKGKREGALSSVCQWAVHQFGIPKSILERDSKRQYGAKETPGNVNKMQKKMRTNIEIDAKLMEQALQLSHLKTKREVVQHALEQYVRRLKRLKMLDLQGKVKWEGNLDEMRNHSSGWFSHHLRCRLTARPRRPASQ